MSGISRYDERSEYEVKQLVDWWLSLSKIILGSMVVKLFEPGELVTIRSVLVAVAGLTLGMIFAKVGLQLARGVNE